MAVVKSIKSNQSAYSEAYTQQGVVGQILQISDEGIALVSYPGCKGVIPARSVLSDNAQVLNQALPVKVFLVFEAGDPLKPIISGIINESPFIKPAPADKKTDVLVDGKRVTLSANDEILLKCGKSSILLRRDGKIVIKGENLISRSSKANKIKGSSVSIN